MSKENNEKNNTVVIRVDQETRRKLKVEASKKQTTIKEYVAFLVNREVEKGE